MYSQAKVLTLFILFIFACGEKDEFNVPGNTDPNGENNSNTFEEFECSPLEKEVYSILKKANDAIHTRIEVAREVMVEKIKNANLCSQEADEGVVENLEEKKIQCDLEKSKALCKRNLQAAVAVAVQK